MPSSLIVAALAVVWLVVLVPMIAKRGQEVARIADSVLASRVLRRRGACRAASQDGGEVPMTGERIAERGFASGERQYRPGRGGYDPEAAALAAREKYVFRQRVVLGLLIGAGATLVLGFVSSSLFWWMHVALDVALVGYLVYLRRQVRIEEEVRRRRAARMAGSRARAVPPAEGVAREGAVPYQADAPHGPPRYDTPWHRRSADGEPLDAGWPVDAGSPVDEQRQVRDIAPPPRAHPTAVALDLDDEDPMFDELDPAFEPPYRRAAGE